ncbi:ABATE domain-containing protein [Streptomyces sp. TLI_171]|uniref:CGNR zinc finger domain-containing protein n=1 Tax=Streptomyces sp. TLI_171 TaxID=1938859 RepID=UPI000C187349|nr:ABATE domain-containing protein [Streptomyces sp. TLI_171]RKE22219.1 putative RNA-binding Zn ribbon-like protein [Streptomyces sp. TLI_171]
MNQRTAAPAVPPPAPGAEQYPALDFANSLLTLPTGPLDLLGTPDPASAWLIEHRLAPVGGRIQEICTARLQGLRAAVRELLDARVTGGAAPTAALAAVNDALTATPSAPLLRWDAERGPYRTMPHPADRIADRAMALLAADAAELLTGPDAERLARCGGAPCTRFFVRTHAARHWCSTRCGDRVRAARAYARKRAAEQS